MQIDGERAQEILVGRQSTVVAASGVTPTDSSVSVRTPGSRPVRWTRPFAIVTAVSLALVLVSYWMPSLGDPIYQRDGAIGNWFNVDEENNLPTWWATTLLGGGAILHLAGAWVARRTHSKGVIAWWLVAALLLTLSLDEATQLHESLEALAGEMEVGVHFGRSWLVFGIPTALGLLVAVLVSGLRLPARTLAAQLMGLGLLFAGAVGMEVIGSRLYDQGPGEPHLRPSPTTSRNFSSSWAQASSSWPP